MKNIIIAVLLTAISFTILTGCTAIVRYEKEAKHLLKEIVDDSIDEQTFPPEAHEHKSQ